MEQDIKASFVYTIDSSIRTLINPLYVYYMDSFHSIPLYKVRVKLRHEDDGLRSIGFLKAENISHGGGNRGQTAECFPVNDVGPADHPCHFSILLIGST